VGHAILQRELNNRETGVVFAMLKKSILALIMLTAAFSLISPRHGLAQTGAGQSAAVLNYQRFGENRYPETSVAESQFSEHVETLGGGRYNVIPARDIVAALYGGKTLPNRSVAITIDDAYRSAYDVAWPLLKKAGLPFTLFVSTDAIDDGGPGFMTWDQIRELRDAGVTIGAHGAAHLHMPESTPEEIQADIESSVRRIEEELGEPPALFSYPHGEITLAARDAIVAAGFKAAFGQHSGTVNEALDRHMLPRFSINGKYGTGPEFDKRINTLGLPLRDISPADPYIEGAAPPVIGFTVDQTVGRTRNLHCFHSDADEDFVEITLTVLEGRRYELHFSEAFPSGPWRVNCTIPTGGKRIRWWGMQYYSAG
jgi:peptidoglycan/xylan/chitin deacetylase (PgdA/CDA1 family)